MNRTIQIEHKMGMEAVAAAIATHLRPGDSLCLTGTLGMGKTTFARALIRALTRPDEPVPSPTYTLVQTYDTPQGPLWHFDLYRLMQAEEVYELGWEESDTAIRLIEWPDRLGGLMPQDRLDILFEAGADEDARCLTFAPSGPRWSGRDFGLGAR
jgi:tRNA threonylcarbamoyladenosine biosynthesis protein TsaE